METFAATAFTFLISSSVATVISVLPDRLAIVVGILVLIGALVLWNEWQKWARPWTDWQRYAPVFAAVLGSIVGGFWG